MNNIKLKTTILAELEIKDLNIKTITYLSKFIRWNDNYYNESIIDYITAYEEFDFNYKDIFPISTNEQKEIVEKEVDLIYKKCQRVKADYLKIR